jgi:hypothetical protein
MRLLTRLSFLTVLLPFHAATAAPTLGSLWPNPDGTRWTFRVEYVETAAPEQSFVTQGYMQLAGQVMTPGGPAQVLLATHPVPVAKATTHASAPSQLPPLLAQVWRARPDLRAKLAAYAGRTAGDPDWYPLLLHDGYFMKGASHIQMWQPGFDHPTWTYLTDDLMPGAEFTQQLVPELADNVFLHGTVESIDTDVQTQAGTLHHAVRMGYRIDYGLAPYTDMDGHAFGLVRSETRGHVHYVPQLGPVELLEEFVPVAEWQCVGEVCPPTDVTNRQGQVAAAVRLSLISSTVAVREHTWSEVKSLFRN